MTRAEHARRMAVEAAQQRRRIAIWLEHLERMERTPARTDEERQAKREALDLMQRAYPAP